MGSLHCVHHNGPNNEIGSNVSNQAVVCVCVWGGGGGGGGDSLFKWYIFICFYLSFVRVTFALARLAIWSSPFMYFVHRT